MICLTSFGARRGNLKEDRSTPKCSLDTLRSFRRCIFHAILRGSVARSPQTTVGSQNRRFWPTVLTVVCVLPEIGLNTCIYRVPCRLCSTHSDPLRLPNFLNGLSLLSAPSNICIANSGQTALISGMVPNSYRNWSTPCIQPYHRRPPMDTSLPFFTKQRYANSAPQIATQLGLRSAILTTAGFLLVIQVVIFLESLQIKSLLPILCSVRKWFNNFIVNSK